MRRLFSEKNFFLGGKRFFRFKVLFNSVVGSPLMHFSVVLHLRFVAQHFASSSKIQIVGFLPSR
jgi:hypothetical protein